MDPDARHVRERPSGPQKTLAQALAEAVAKSVTQQPPRRTKEEEQKKRGVIKNANECGVHALPVDALRPT